jgi:hypothetical protein
MKRVSVLLGILGILVLTTVALAATSVPPFPKTLINARYVYVTSYDGDQFDFNLLQEDRQAISSVQDAAREWGRYIVVYRPEDADIILRVQSRGSEDVLAVYDAHMPGSTFLWRVMGRGGLQQGETPLVTQLQQAVDKVSR